MRGTRKLLPALAMLLVAFVVMTTASYAWFTMNRSVSVTGMKVNVTAESNLLIANSSAGTSKAADSAFGTNVTISKTGGIRPVSTVDGVNFYYTDDAKADGDAINDSYTLVSGDQVGGLKAYMDYVFELKAVNTETNPTQIVLTKLNLLYNNAPITAEKAFRVAIFIQAQAADGDAYETIGAEADAIYTIAGAQNLTPGKAVASEDGLDEVTYNGSLDNKMPVAIEGTAYYKVTVRLWLEGEDTTCNNTTFRNLKGNWTLDLQFDLGGTPVENISTD